MLGYYETERMEDPCYVIVAVNRKEYIENFESDSVNKGHKGFTDLKRNKDLFVHCQVLAVVL